VAQVNIFGAKRYAVRVRVQPDALAARNMGWTSWRGAACGQRQHAGRHAGRAPQTLTLQANRSCAMRPSLPN
jgi:HAE1 family hydrophobic/amphiphilic exporter-1